MHHQHGYSGGLRAESDFVCCKQDKDGQALYLDFLRDLFKDRNYVALAYMTAENLELAHDKADNKLRKQAKMAVAPGIPRRYNNL